MINSNYIVNYNALLLAIYSEPKRKSGKILRNRHGEPLYEINSADDAFSKLKNKK